MIIPIPTNPEALGSSAHFQAYADASSRIDLVANAGAPCRRIRAQTSGTLVVKRASDGATITLNLLSGETQEAQALSIESGTALGLTVYW